MNNELVETKPFLVMDRADEKQVLAEMRGEIIKEYVYSYSQGSKVVEGLSLAGINAVAIHMAENGYPIRVINQWITEDEKYIKAIVKVGRFSVSEEGIEVMLDSTLGAKRQARNYSSGVENPFAYELAITKAERNARKKLMPEKIIIEMMKEYKSQGREVELSPKTEQESNEIEQTTPQEDVPQAKPKKKDYPITPNQRTTAKKYGIDISDIDDKKTGFYETRKRIGDSKAKSKKKKITRGDGKEPLIADQEAPPEEEY